MKLVKFTIEKSRLFTLSTLTVSSTFLLFLFILKIFNGPNFVWNGARLLSSVGTVLGIRVFFNYNEFGPFISGVNGPVGTLAYLPAGFAHDPHQAIYTGISLALIYYYGVALFFFLKIPNNKSTLTSRIFLFLVFSFLSLGSSALNYSSTIVHVDAPALALVMLSLWFLLIYQKIENWQCSFLTSLFAVLALFTKITFLPMLIATTVCIFIAVGFKKGIINLLFSILISLLLSLIFSLWMGWDNFLFHQFTSHLGYSWRTAVNGESGTYATHLPEIIKSLISIYFEIIKEYYMHYSVILIGFGYYLSQKKKSQNWRLFWTEHPSLTCTLIAFLMLPPALLAHSKIGGAVNTQSPHIVFILLACLFVLSDILQATEKKSSAFMFLVLFLCFTQGKTAYSLLHFLKDAGQSPHIKSFQLAQKYSEQIYFPEYPLSTLISDHKIYHSYMMLVEYKYMGLTLSDERFKKHMPDKIRWILLTSEAHSEFKNYIKDFKKISSPIEFTGWVVYERN